ncbi:hypothetical protein BJY52DRAFT_1230443 [Lactarius psammicola]|nr:hypothetical protein BJY52DRAFT_1230443 [Lactarius psammicola]
MEQLVVAFEPLSIQSLIALQQYAFIGDDFDPESERTGPIYNDDEDDNEPMDVPQWMSCIMMSGHELQCAIPIRCCLDGIPGPMDCIRWHLITLQEPARQSLNAETARCEPERGCGLECMGVDAGMVDPRMLMAHRQAMVIAKQTCQLAVEQQTTRTSGSAGVQSAGGAWQSLEHRCAQRARHGYELCMNMKTSSGVNLFGMPPTSDLSTSAYSSFHPIPPNHDSEYLPSDINHSHFVARWPYMLTLMLT